MMMVRTRMGFGILDKRYHALTGVGIYWHIHGDLVGLCRLVNSGVLAGSGTAFAVSRAVAVHTEKVRYTDMPAYQVLTECWGFLDREPGGWAICDPNGCMYASTLYTMMEELAGFVGCPLTADRDACPVGWVKCRRPALLEILLLCFLTEARLYSASGEVSCRISTLGDVEREGLALTMHYPVENTHRKGIDLLSAIHRHLQWAGDLSGLSVFAEVCPPKRGERKLGGLYEMQIALEWIRDPAVLSTSDLKNNFPFERKPDFRIKE